MKNFYKKHILPYYLDKGMQQKYLERERPEIALEAQGVVLEIGFGSGLNLPYYQNITKFYALDPSEELYVLAKERIDKISFPFEHLIAPAEKIPLPDNSADAVVSTWTMCSLTDPKLAMQEIKRVLNRDGKFIFIEHGKSPKKLYALIQNILTPILKHFAGECHMNRDIEKIIVDSELKIIKLEKYPEAYKPLNHTYKGVAVKKS